VLRSQESRRAFLGDRGHRIRSVFLPKHTPWLNQVEIVFAMIMRKVIRRGNFTSVADLKDKLARFIAYFNEVFAKRLRGSSVGTSVTFPGTGCTAGSQNRTAACGVQLSELTAT
jgi:hypothetical protein